MTSFPLKIVTADGLVYYTMTDVHHARKGAVAAALAVENLDFLVILGDSVGMVEYEKDVQFSNVLAHDVTKGEIPVVYARGNHEIKGAYAEELYKYVGSKNESFYYWFTLSNVFDVSSSNSFVLPLANQLVTTISQSCNFKRFKILIKISML